MDKLSEPSFAVPCGGHRVKMEIKDGHWVYCHSDHDVRRVEPPEAGLADQLQRARELLFTAQALVPSLMPQEVIYRRDAQEWMSSTKTFLAVTGVATPSAKPVSKYGPEPDWSSPDTWPKYTAAQPTSPPAPQAAAEPEAELIKGDCPTLDLSVPKEHREIYAYMLQQKVAINLLVDAVKQMRRQQAGGK